MGQHRITLHHNPAIPWHRKVDAFEKGLKALQWDVTRTHSRVRINDDPAVLFGTSGYKAIEQAPGDWLLIDRACWGDPEYVRLGWNGHGTDADYCIPEDVAPRWIPSLEPIESGDNVIVCCDYDSVPAFESATHIKLHPAQRENPTNLPLAHTFDGCRLAYCGNSTVAVDLQLRGVPVKVGPLSMANMSLEDISWTQWSWEEIEQGEPIRHLFEWLT